MPETLTAVTIGWLESEGACAEQVRMFRRTFGESAELTSDNLTRAAKAGLHLGWLADLLLSGVAMRAYLHSKQAARSARAYVAEVAWLALERVEAAARAAKDRAPADIAAEARAEYERVTATARAEYSRAMEAAWAEYWLAESVALADALGLP